jgi:hypothetical protein
LEGVGQFCQYDRHVLFLYQLGLVDRKTRDEVHNLEQQTVRSIESGDYDEAYTVSYFDPEQRYFTSILMRPSTVRLDVLVISKPVNWH